MATSLNLAYVDVTSTGLTTATTAYTAGDLVGAEGFIIIPGNLTDGLLMAVTVLDEADVMSSVAIVFGTAAMSMGSDNAAPSISDANARLIKGDIDMPFIRDLGGCRTMAIDSLGLPLHADVGSTGVAFRLITNTGHTFFGAAGDVKCRFGFSKDA